MLAVRSYGEIGREEELPAIKEEIPASIICFDMSCAS
jgi:hypothetical protein